MSHGILFWGFEVAAPLPWGDDWTTLAVERLGLDPLPRRHDDEVRAKLIEKASGCTIGSFGVASVKVDTSSFVAIRASVIQTLGCVPIAVTRVEPDWRTTLHLFCTKLGIPWAEPAWVLTSEMDG